MHHLKLLKLQLATEIISTEFLATESSTTEVEATDITIALTTEAVTTEVSTNSESGELASSSGSGSGSGSGIDDLYETTFRVAEPETIATLGLTGDQLLGIPFTIALSNLGGGQVQVSVESEVITVMVNCPDGQAALGLECRPTLCPESYV